MLRFECDYGEGAAPAVLELLQKTNFDQTPGYGEDEYCAKAAAQIKRLCDAPDADVHFFVGATQANLTVIAAALKPWQGVLCADSGHIHVHETGSIEATGHKCLALPGKNGKITARQIRKAVEEHRANASHEHEVQPGMVYISNPTEVGTLYNKEELTDISAACYELGLYLFVDGARMAYGLTSPANDLSLQDYAALCDVFYLGGTKCGALFGEAVVITNDDLKPDFRYCLKQHGGMLAKGRRWVSSSWPCWTARTAAAAACISRWRKKPTSRPCASALPLRRRAARCCTTPRRTSSSLFCPTSGTTSWPRPTP